MGWGGLSCARTAWDGVAWGGMGWGGMGWDGAGWSGARYDSLRLFDSAAPSFAAGVSRILHSFTADLGATVLRVVLILAVWILTAHW